ncbi:hypothetical protein B5M42_016990 [Paenibacillus athensensis]|uniref:Uncharacterized protein n=1 Tax=Paenibacillus athensensis TaxID=1967502 RepID=A0A4Y8PRQ0_9BACL|nr:hypothetical protein [Paenibacillus athensensis]MCD1260499.1 hypothetical protein [Paenibacillus athensensis]
MKKTRYYPFERNRYFYGKLLTVRDFESEQQYFNDKRRMMNRLLHGSGIITGLQVVAVDTKNVSVEMGAAIDALGREIVVPSPLTYKLSSIKGFTNNEYTKNVYLCLAYEEKGKEPAHSLANASARSDEVGEYNRILEGFKLFIREQAPDPSSLPYADLIGNTVVLCDNSQLRVLLTTPRYVNPGELFEATVRFEKTLLAGQVSFSFELDTERLEPVNGAKVTFSEEQEPQLSMGYERKIMLRADSTVSETGLIGIRSGTAVLKIGDKQVDGVSTDLSEVEIIKGSVPERLMDDFLKSSLDDALDSPAEPCIYLAKIGLQQSGPTYVIETVEQVPFNEYVYNTSVMYRLSQLTGQPAATGGGAAKIVPKAKLRTPGPGGKPEFKVSYNSDSSELSFDVAIPASSSAATDIRTGVVDIPVTHFNKLGVSPFGKAHKSFFSDEITHNLGAGNVLIVTSIEETSSDTFSEMLSSGERVYFGSPDVFKGSEFEPDVPDIKVGAIAYPQKGTFRVGANVQHVGEGFTLRVRWWAYKEGATIPRSGSGGGASVDAAISGMLEAAPADSGEQH